MTPLPSPAARCRRNRRGAETGVTLLELLIAAALAGALAGLVAAFYIGAWRNFLGTTDRAARLGRAAGALTTLIGDVRASRGVVTAVPGRLDVWIADRNADDFVQADEIVAYRLEPSAGGKRLAREAAGNRTILVEDIADAAWAADEPPPSTRRLWITLRLAPDDPPIVTGAAVHNAPEAP